MFKIEKSNTICLCMIVKNEEHIIDKCLKSVAPLIDYYVICDTGSTDNTIDIIKKTSSDLGLKGDILNHKWINFAHNRTLSLKAARSKADYVLIIDADETLQFNKNFIDLHHLDKDAYNIETVLGVIRYNRLQLLSNKLEWYYEGVVHEYPTARCLRTIDKIVEFYNVSTIQGSRSRNPNKYLEDAKLLEEDLLTDRDNSRSVFYLAQSYRDAKCYKEARENYIKRLGMNGYDEELIVCYSQIGYCSKMLGDNIDDYIHYYLDGYNRFPHRLECLYDYIICLKISGNSKLAIDIGFKKALTPYPQNDSLFILKDIYDFLFRVELANCCIDQKMYKQAIILLKYTLEMGEVPIKNKADIYTKIINLCDQLRYTTITTTRPIEIIYNMDDLSKSIIDFNILYTPITIQYNTNNTISLCLKDKITYDDTIDMEIVKTLLNINSLDLNVYLEVMNNDLKYIKQYKNIINFSRDIVILGEPSYDFLEKISKLVIDINRIFILLYEDDVFNTDKSKLIDTNWNLIIGNVGKVKDVNSYVDIIGVSGVNDLMIGWIEVCDDRLTYLATP
jgi:glycosyltransferase involved in cell wall biosynthesis